MMLCDTFPRTRLCLAGFGWGPSGEVPTGGTAASSRQERDGTVSSVGKEGGLTSSEKL